MNNWKPIILALFILICLFAVPKIERLNPGYYVTVIATDTLYNVSEVNTYHYDDTLNLRAKIYRDIPEGYRVTILIKNDESIDFAYRIDYICIKFTANFYLQCKYQSHYLRQ